MGGGAERDSSRPRRVRLSSVTIPALVVTAFLAVAPASTTWITGRGPREPAAAPPRTSTDLTTQASAEGTVNANSASFTYVPGSGGGAVSGIEYNPAAPAALVLTVYGMPPQPGEGSSALVYADLYNGTGKKLLFPGGAAVRVTLDRGGQRWKDVVLDQPATPSLDPDQRIRLETSVPLDASGRYDLSARVIARDGNPAFILTGP
jgi:hypothetical protein